MDENQVTNTEEGATPKKWNPFIIGMGVVVLALVVFALARSLGSKQSGETKVTTEIPDAGVTETASKPRPSAVKILPDEVEVRTIAVEGGAFYYKPNEIRVKKGEKVKIVLSSKDMVHDFVIDELGVRTPVTKAGDTATVEFTVDKTGTFEYYCSVGQHRKNGMVGKLIVE